MGLKDIRGVPTSTRSQASLDQLEAALDLAITMRADPIALLDEALEEKPGFVVGLCLRAEMLLLTTERARLPQVARDVEMAEALTGKANDRERGHIAAIRAWLEGDLERATDCWESVLLNYPRDLIALFCAHMTDFFLGEAPQMRDRISRALRGWDADTAGYGYVLGMYAFALEEAGDFTRGEEYGRKAVELNPLDVYAIHAVAHVMEMQGRQEDGINWMTERQSDWAVDCGFAIHLWWHTAMYHLDLEQYDRVFEIYENGIRHSADGISLEELDAASMLWRLNLLGVDVGDRWWELADRWEPSAEDTYYAFNDMHAMMTFAGAGRDMAAAKLLAATASYVTERGGTNAQMTKDVGIPVCRALLAFSRQDYGMVVDLLLPIRYRSNVFGGSYAQRDVIALTLIEAAIRAGRFPLAHALLAERAALKENSPMTWKLMARALDGLGDRPAADNARGRAEALLAGIRPMVRDNTGLRDDPVFIPGGCLL